MLRDFHLADLFTIANGFCGVAALFAAMRFLATGDRPHLYWAALLVPVALVFDVLDGRIARWRHVASPMGRELDSLADVISFGVAPAGIAYAAGPRTIHPWFPAPPVFHWDCPGCGGRISDHGPARGLVSIRTATKTAASAWPPKHAAMSAVDPSSLRASTTAPCARRA